MTVISTGEKLDWLDAVMADHRIDARAKVVAFCIMQHVNRDTGLAFLSDPTISDKTGIPTRCVLRARNALRSVGWINWKRTGTANVYSTFTTPMMAVAERQRTLKLARDKRREEPPRVADLDPPQVADLTQDDTPPLAEHDPPQVAEHDPPPVANIPLSLNPVVITPSKKSLAMIIDSTSDFGRFWSIYPKKVDKLRAEKLYTAIIKSERATAAELLAGATRYAAEKAGTERKYIKHPSTWLSAGAWLDEPQANVDKPIDRADSAIAGMRRFLNRGALQ